MNASSSSSATLPHLSQHFIDGQWVAPVTQQSLDVVNPTTEKVLQGIARGSAEDVARAVDAAARAFPSWSETTGTQRAVYLRAMAAAVSANAQALARMETEDSGKTLAEALWDMEDVVACFQYYATAAETLDTRQNERVALPSGDEYSASLRFEPVGVAAAIIPWNYPLLMALWKVAPALAAGCTMVLKPSELTPLTALQLARLASEAGLPNGVLNVVTGLGAEAGAALVRHPKVHKVAFTGSVPTGRAIMAAAAEDIKTVSLELGGKSPALVMDRHHLARTVEWVMFGCFGNNGQVCSATSRLLVHEDIADELLALLIAETKKLTVGDPLVDGVKVGPLVSKLQQDKVLGYIAGAVQEGATVACQTALPEHATKLGFFVAPTILTNVTADMRVWREEIFGPVLSVMTFKTEQDAIALANDSDFGLAAAVFSSDASQLARITKALRVGIVWNNCSQPNFVELPWGGMKKSGIGRELGPFGLDAYLEVKQVCAYTADKAFGFYLDA